MRHVCGLQLSMRPQAFFFARLARRRFYFFFGACGAPCDRRHSYYIRDLIPHTGTHLVLYMCPRTSYYYTYSQLDCLAVWNTRGGHSCVLVPLLLYMCPRTSTTIHVSSYLYYYICVLIPQQLAARLSGVVEHSGGAFILYQEDAHTNNSGRSSRVQKKKRQLILYYARHDHYMCDLTPKIKLLYTCSGANKKSTTSSSGKQ